MSWSERWALLRAAASKKPAQEAMSILSKISPGGGDPPPRGSTDILESYATMPWMRACASKVAASIASVEWRLYVTRRKGAQKAYRDHAVQRAGHALRKALLQDRSNAGELTEVTDHPFLDLLTKGNGHHSGVALRRLESIYMDLVGEAFLLKSRNGLRVPSALWPIPPTWVQRTPTPDQPTFGISYRGWQANIPQSEILYMCDPNPAQPYGRGVGYGHALSDELEIDEYAAKHTRQVFFNRAQPDFLIYPKGERADMNRAETQRFETDWLNKLQGYWRSSKPYFLSREVGVYEFQKSIKDLMLIEIRNQERDIIIQTYGIPPEKMGIVENSNRATIEASDLIYSKDVLVPRLEFRRSIFQEQLAPEYDDRLIVDYVTPVMEDKEFALKVATAAPWAMDGNEWRAAMGLEPKPEFEGVYFVPPAVTPVSADQLVVEAGAPVVDEEDDVPPPVEA